MPTWVSLAAELAVGGLGAAAVYGLAKLAEAKDRLPYTFGYKLDCYIFCCVGT